MRVFVVQFLGLPLLQFEWGRVDEDEPRHLGASGGGDREFGFRVQGNSEPPNPSLYTDPD